MDHLEEFRPRAVLPAPLLEDGAWQLKRYAIVADGRDFDEDIVAAAGKEALRRLPPAGGLSSETGAHGIGFQIVHFAQVAVVSPVFYWQWGSVLAKIDQLRASWDKPTLFGDGVKEFVGCIWEMDIVSFEIAAWKRTILGADGSPAERLAAYTRARFS